jgi:hypothetical protein
MLPVTQKAGFVLDARVMQTFPTFGTVLAPSFSFAAGF